MTSPIDLVLGLGNPGEEYAPTRHNMGFRVVEEVAARHGQVEWLHRPSCELAVIAAGRFVVLARPRTFMNRSGAAARWLLDELRLRPENMMVVVDDVDLPLATLRLRLSGGPGTHNGLRDLCQVVGKAFPRLRVGVQGAGRSEDLAEYVLSPFSDDETKTADSAVVRAADAVEAVLGDGFEPAMNAFNRPPSP